MPPVYVANIDVASSGFVTNINVQASIAKTITVSGGAFVPTVSVAGSGYVANINVQTSIARSVAVSSVSNIGVLSLTAGAGISVDRPTGAVTVSNTGVLSVAGTTGEVVVSGSTGNVTLSLPQAIATSSSPTFANLTLSGLTAKSFLYSGTGGALTTTSAPTNGQILIGSTGAAPAASTLTAGSGISISNGAGSVTIGNTGVTSLTGTSSQVIASGSTGAVTLSLPQSIGTGSSPTFAQVTITNAPSAGTDTANKAYVDSVANGLSVHPEVSVLQSTNISIASPGTATFDGVTISSGSRILLTGQTTTSQNGIWIFNGSTSALTRPTDFNGTIDGSAITTYEGSCVFVGQGTNNANTFWVLTTNNPITINTTGQTWAQFGGPGTYVAGSGLSLSGSTFSINSSYVGQTSITTLGTITTGTWNGTAIDLTAHVTGVLPAANGGTGVNNSSTITLAGNLHTAGAFTTTGAFPISIAATASTSITLPTSGTLVNTSVATLSSLASVGTITTGVWNGTAIGPTFGGTGLTSYTTGNLLYASASNTLSALAIGTTSQILTVVSGKPAWATPSGSATLANPTNLVGLTANNGTLTSVCRSDATHALDVSIAPTWTGAHTFNAGVTMSTGVGITLTVNTLSGATIGQAIKAGTGQATSIAIAANGSTPGSGSVDVVQDSIGNGYLVNRGNFPLNFYTNNTQRMQIGAAGNLTVNTPSSGATVTINSLGTASGLTIVSPTGTANTLSSGSVISFGNGTTSGTCIQSSGNQTELWQFNSSWIQPLKITSGGNLVLNYAQVWPNNVWNTSIEGAARIYFASGGPTYISSAASLIYQAAGGANVLTCDNSGNLAITGAFEGNPYGLTFTLPDTSGTGQYVHLGTWTTSQVGMKILIKVAVSSGYNAITAQTSEYDINFQTSNSVSAQSGSTGSYFGAGNVWQRGGSIGSALTAILVIQNSATSYDFYAACSAFTGQSFYTVHGSNGCTWTNSSTLFGATAPTGNNISLPFYTTFDSTSRLQRATTSGYMDGDYNVGAGPGETGTTAGCLYTIGGTLYRPNTAATNALGSMYGVGYSTSTTTMGNGTSIAAHLSATGGDWGLYVASNGIANIFLNSDSGDINSAGSIGVAGNIGGGGAFYLGGLLTAYNAGDGWLRLNNSSSYGNGVYTPLNLRCDGSFFIGGSANLTAGTANYGRSFQIGGSAPGGYYGLLLNDGGILATFMSNGSSAGVYFNSGRWSWFDTGTFTINQGVSAPSYSISSDARLKTNVVTIANALDTVTKLRGVTFKWNDKAGSQKGKDGMGLIAQEVEQVLPELIGEFQVAEEGTPDLKETYKNVQYGNLVAVLIEAVKELKAANDDLYSRVQALEAR
jgi:trimeric autotransporter adhesin